ncbi:MAG: AAA family ATPase, partial [Spirochaetaceae bacterium]|nr:AAA family ATPase [Spirochaetaceae bacterium]
MKRRLPLGIQDFPKLREGGYCYVDKTARIYDLITGSGSQVFLSRPRRFGKSLLCSTLGAIFDGRRELFKGLAIDSTDWEWKKHPVIRIDLNAGRYEEGHNYLDTRLECALKDNADSMNVAVRGDVVEDQFANLIKNLHIKTNEKVIVIVDEYDKPLLNTIENVEMHKRVRTALKSFYGVLKSSDAYLQFVFLTGVTKFSQVSIFSDLNHLSDISLDRRYADLCGITQ